MKAYRSYCYLMTAHTGETLELIKGFFKNCTIARLGSMQDGADSRPVYIVRANEGAKFEKTDDGLYTGTIQLVVSGYTFSEEIDRNATYDLPLKDFAGAVFEIHEK